MKMPCAGMDLSDAPVVLFRFHLRNGDTSFAAGVALLEQITTQEKWIESVKSAVKI